MSEELKKKKKFSVWLWVCTLLCVHFLIGAYCKDIKYIFLSDETDCVSCSGWMSNISLQSDYKLVCECERKLPLKGFFFFFLIYWRIRPCGSTLSLNLWAASTCTCSAFLCTVGPCSTTELLHVLDVLEPSPGSSFEPQITFSLRLTGELHLGFRAIFS